MALAFFCRGRPQGCDAFPIFERASRVFIGYPLPRSKGLVDPTALRDCLVDPSCSYEEWLAVKNKNRNHSRNRNFVGKVNQALDDGVIVIVPRPGDGDAHLARLTSRFEIVNNPPWAADYLALRTQQHLKADPASNHIADVAQGWRVDGYRKVELSRLPGWIRHSTLGRSTFGALPMTHPLDPAITAYSVLKALYEGERPPPPEWTLDVDEIRKRLVDTLTPTSFEHLVVSLLQLENPDEMWLHTGGPGDGGIDGIGSDGVGAMVGLLQAKLVSGRAPEFAKPGLRCYGAVLLPLPPDPPRDNTILLDLDWTAAAVRRHWRRLPQAFTLRVGSDR